MAAARRTQLVLLFDGTAGSDDPLQRPFWTNVVRIRDQIDVASVRWWYGCGVGSLRNSWTTSDNPKLAKPFGRLGFVGLLEQLGFGKGTLDHVLEACECVTACH